MAKLDSFLRYASPNERRTISREDLGLYYAVIFSAVYEFDPSFKVKEVQSYFAPLRKCIEEHPFLSVAVGDAHTDKAFYERVPSINAEDHITILPQLPEGQDDSAAVAKIVEKDLDKPFNFRAPLWRIIVLPLSASRAWVVFSYSHAMGDGPSGTSFHQTFLKALRDTPTEALAASSGIIAAPNHQLGAPFDTPERLPISWAFLLKPLLGAILPNFLVNLIGIKASPAACDQGTWYGTRIGFKPETLHTKLHLREIDAPVLAAAIRAARAHEARLTGTFLQLIARALARALPDTGSITNFVSQNAVNMRRCIGIPAGEMGEFVSGIYAKHPLPASPPRRAGAS